MARIFVEGDESSALELMSVLNLFGNDKLEDNVNSIISGLVPSLTINTSPDIKTLNILNSVLKLKYKLRDAEAIEGDGLQDCKNICNLCLSLLEYSSDIKGEYFFSLCNVLHQTLLLMGKNSFYNCVTNIMMKCQHNFTLFLNSTDIEESKFACTTGPEVSLRILETILAAVLDKQELNNVSNAYETEELGLVDDNMQNLIINLVWSNVDHISVQTLLSVIPKVLMCSADNILLQKIWMNITVKFDRVSDLSCTFQILCILAQFYLPYGLQNVQISYNVAEDNDFWKILQSGLTSTDPLIRKQALYLMKRAIDGVSQNNSSVSLQCPDAIFWWDPADLNQVWEHFFLIIETLEEKQVHIIKPVLLVIDSLTVSSNKGHVLHVSWLLCVFHRIVSHDNNSVVKWGILNFVRVYRESDFVRKGNSILGFLGPFMNAVNNSSLYSGNSEHSSLSEIGEALRKLFESVVTESSHEDCRAFFCCVLDVMKAISWAPVPLFNVTHALAYAPSVPVWDKQRIGVMKNFISEALGCESVFIRGAVQCMLLGATIHFADCNSLDVHTVADYLEVFRSSEALKRDASVWHDTVEWIKVFISKKDAARFLVTTLSASETGASLSTRAVARMVVLLCDASLMPCDMSDEEGSLARFLCSELSCFHNCDKRLYACEAGQNHALELIVCLLNESHTICETDLVRKTILGYVNLMLDQIFMWISRRMSSVTHLREYHLVDTYVTALSSFASVADLMPRAKPNLSKLHDMALQMAVTPTAPPMCQYFSMRVLSCIAGWLRKVCHCTCGSGSPCVVIKRQSSLIGHIVGGGRLNSPPVKQEADLKLTRDLQTLWGKLTSRYLESGWSIVADLLHSCCKAEDQVLSLRSVVNIVSDISEALEIGGRSVLVPLMNVLERIMLRSLVDEMFKLISSCWIKIFELRKTELFWTSMEAFMQMLFQPSVMATAICQDHLCEYSDKIFSQGEAVAGLCNMFVKRMQKVVALSSPDILEQYCSVLVKALTFGPVHRRDQRAIMDTCRFISSLGEKCTISDLASNDCCIGNEVRARALQLLLAACSSSRRHHLVRKLMDELVQRDKTESSFKTRYYGDSQIHRMKHRVMQSILIIEPLLDLEGVEKLLQWLKDSLLTESQQPSVRYQQEWLLARLIHRHPHLRDSLWVTFQQAREKRPGSICSLIAVVYHVACVLNDEQEEFVDRSVHEILPWCMAQHFSVRLYAQTTLQKLFVLCKQRHCDRVAEKYAIVNSSLQTCMEQGNAVKNSQKLQEDFYFSSFHPIEHYTLETIFYDLPRLANVTYEEWISPDLLRSCEVSAEGHIDLENKNSSLKQFSGAAWVLKSRGGAEDDDTDATTGLHTNVQKKLVPWRSMIPGQDLEVEKRQEGLIVVASLIDRLPNLGGLSRTCEVFGVSEYVLGSLKYTEDKQFRSLSVTAERWIPISEVKPHLLPKYLEIKKKNGYTLVGAEQTANSVHLSDFRFPRKTLLLLGNEKEGIPADLLPLLDSCVEIPQQGVVRSLNVHVTGALFVWEYTRQHTLT